jgi:hypothetical protein
MYLQKVISRRKKSCFGVLKVIDENRRIRIRIHWSEARIPGSVPKCHGSATLDMMTLTVLSARASEIYFQNSKCEHLSLNRLTTADGGTVRVEQPISKWWIFLNKLELKLGRRKRSFFVLIVTYGLKLRNFYE